MAKPPASRIACPNCGKQYKWNPQIAGRKVKCAACEQKMRMPSAQESKVEPIGPLLSEANQASTGAYELDLPDDEKDASAAPEHSKDESIAKTSGGTSGETFGGGGARGKCPSCNSRMKADAVLCINCGFHVADGKKITTATDLPAEGSEKKRRVKKGKPTEKGFRAKGYVVGENPITAALDAREGEAKPNPFIELWLPLGLIVLGLAVNIVEQLYFMGPATKSWLYAVLTLGIEVVISIPLLLVAMIASVKLLDVSFGPLGQALFKLLAIVLGPSAIGAMVAVSLVPISGEWFGAFIGWFVSLGIYWGLLICLFALEGLEAIYLMVIIWMIHYIAGMFLVIIAASVLT